MLKMKKMINDLSVLSDEIFYFKVVFEQRSINGASRHLSRDSGNISRAITKLERRLGSPLFVRHKTGLNSTEFGERFYRAISSAQEEFSKKISEKSESRRIKIGFSPAIGYSHFSPSIINAINALGLSPEFTVKSSQQLIELVKSRELDFVLVHQSPKFPGIVAKQISTENLVLCSQSGELQKTMILHQDMLGLERIIYSIQYDRRWMISDYFIIAKMLSENQSVMGILPEGIARMHSGLRTVQVFNAEGKITALTWPGSSGLDLLKAIAK